MNPIIETPIEDGCFHAGQSTASVIAEMAATFVPAPVSADALAEVVLCHDRVLQPGQCPICTEVPGGSAPASGYPQWGERLVGGGFDPDDLAGMAEAWARQMARLTRVTIAEAGIYQRQVVDYDQWPFDCIDWTEAGYGFAARLATAEENPDAAAILVDGWLFLSRDRDRPFDRNGGFPE